MTCCTGNCRQGRDCPNTDATLAALGFYHEEDDEPPWSLSDVEPWIWFVIAGSLLVIAYAMAQLAPYLIEAVIAILRNI